MRMKYFGMIAVVLYVCTGVTVLAAERPRRVKVEVEEKPAPVVVVPVTVLSIIPAQAEPGGKVTLSGTGFGERAAIFLGSQEITPVLTAARQAEFTIPSGTDAGLYALYLKRSDGTVGRTYNFTVLPVRPHLAALQPDRISSCAAGREREITARGANFVDTSLLFFDGAALAGTVSPPDTITFMLPAVGGGLHHVQVKNGSDNSSVPLNIVVETRPEIGQVMVGNEFVNYYELNISGKNFTQNSSIYVDGVQIGGRGGQDMDREKLIYVDCTRLVYQRHPYSPVSKDFRLQVVNPGGEGSQVITVTAP